MRNGGFVLRELVVCLIACVTLGAVGVVLAAEMTTAEHDARNLANLRLTMVDFQAWSGAHQDTMPNAGLPDDPEAAWFYPQGISAQGRLAVYPSQQTHWSKTLLHWRDVPAPYWHSTYGYNFPRSADPSRFTDEQAIRLMPSFYVYSMTLLTAPEAWQWPQRKVASYEEYATLYRVVRASDIAHPSAKGVLLHRKRMDEPLRWHVAFADGSAALKDPAEGLPAACHPTAKHELRGTPVLHTLDGYLGRDF